EYLLNDQAAALDDLQAAAAMNPSDDLALRTLALARRDAGDPHGAESALMMALRAKRSDTANLLLLAKWEVDDGTIQAAVKTLGEVIQAWPAMVGAPGWPQLLPKGVGTQGLVAEAIARWKRGDPSPEPLGGQNVWLAV